MPHNVDSIKLRSVIDHMGLALRQEKCVDVLLNFLNSLTKFCNFTKATVYALDPLMQATFKKGLTKDRRKYCTTVSYKDAKMGAAQNLLGVANSDKLCTQIAFDSIEET